MAAILKIYFFASSPEPKGQLTPNLLGSIRMTCRSKIAKIVPIGNPRWPPWPPSWKFIFRFYSWTDGQLTPNFVGGIGVTYRSKIAKIVPIGNPRWPPWQPSWKSIFRFFFWTERPFDSKLDRKHRGDLYIKNSKNHADLKTRMDAMAAILKIYFSLLLLNRKASWLQTW